LSKNKVANGISLKAQPNPSFGQTSLQFFLPDKTEGVLSITDLAGREVFKKFVSASGSALVDLKAGVYAASLRSNNQLMGVKIVVSQ
jgi:hypothetical protein